MDTAGLEGAMNRLKDGLRAIAEQIVQSVLLVEYHSRLLGLRKEPEPTPWEKAARAGKILRGEAPWPPRVNIDAYDMLDQLRKNAAPLPSKKERYEKLLIPGQKWKRTDSLNIYTCTGESEGEINMYLPHKQKTLSVTFKSLMSKWVPVKERVDG